MTKWRLLTFVAVWVVLSTMLLAASADPALLVIGGIVASALAGLFVIADSNWLTEPPVWSGRRRPAASDTPSDPLGEDLRRHSRAAVHTDSTVVHARLLGILDDAVLDRYEIDRTTHPSAADPRLTPALRRLATGPSRRIGSTGELRQIINDIENL